MFFVYVLFSPSINQYYIGQTQNIEDRILRHNSGRSLSTKKTNDWILKYSETFNSRSEAILREKAIKKMKSRKYVESLINSLD